MKASDNVSVRTFVYRLLQPLFQAHCGLNDVQVLLEWRRMKTLLSQMSEHQRAPEKQRSKSGYSIWCRASVHYYESCSVAHANIAKLPHRAFASRADDLRSFNHATSTLKCYNIEMWRSKNCHRAVLNTFDSYLLYVRKLAAVNVFECILLCWFEYLKSCITAL